ncbi:hypothetical protein [Eikenella sp. NML03-A-027]|uniref:hypothetical protein n=1 Tax=Eikenella sp. NML03-A-027 TaxID=1795828 RepID=UPI000AC24E1D|nr:hypothetical protein [Eikenella sp. NML03-A-027]
MLSEQIFQKTHTMSCQELGLIFLLAGVFCICFAGFRQLYVMITESYTLNHF